MNCFVSNVEAYVFYEKNVFGNRLAQKKANEVKEGVEKKTTCDGQGQIKKTRSILRSVG